MAEEKEEPKGIDRRQFVIGAGAVVITGALAASKLKASKPGKEKPLEVSGVIVHDAEKCVGCGVCGLMCSLYHEGEQGPALSRSEIVRDPFNYDFTFNVCQQCLSPSCYFACPLRDKALCIDGVTGVRYVNEDECDGCGECIAACPLDPKRIKLHAEKSVVFNCDLCRGRGQGPICVEYCTMAALTLMTKDKR